MKRIFAAVAALLIVGAIAAAIGTSGAGASSSSAQERSSQGIVIGHYEGRDSTGNHIRFYIDHHDAFVIPTFRINHLELGAVHVKDAAFSHDCNARDFCAHGHWTNIDQVSGGWRHHSGHTSTYTAHWVEKWSSH